MTDNIGTNNYVKFYFFNKIFKIVIKKPVHTVDFVFNCNFMYTVGFYTYMIMILKFFRKVPSFDPISNILKSLSILNFFFIQFEKFLK